MAQFDGLKKSVILLAMTAGLSFAMTGASVAQDGAAAPEAAPAAAPEAVPAGGFLQAPARLAIEVIQAFLADPASFLEEFPVGGLGLSNKVRALAGSDVATVPVLIDLAATAGLSQRAAIGAGLARAAQAALVTRPDIAEYIQQQVALSNNQQLTTAFLSGSGAPQTAAITGAAAPAGGLGGAVGGGAPAVGAAGIGGAPGGGATGQGAGNAVGTGGGSLSGGGGGGSAGSGTVVRRVVSPTL